MVSKNLVSHNSLAWASRRSGTTPDASLLGLDLPGQVARCAAIKAEVVAFEDLVAAGTMVAVRAAGKARIEGKDYVMRDGDVVEFRVNA